MIYKKNVGGREQILRLAAGAAMVACGLFGLPGNVVGYLIAGMGVVTALTGLFGFCPACAMAGRQIGPENR